MELGNSQRMGMTLGQLGERIGATVRGDPTLEVEGCAGLEEAGPRQVSFLANRKYLKLLSATRAGAVIVSPQDGSQAPETMSLLVAKDPYFAFREAVVALHGMRRLPPAGIHPLAVIDASAQIGEGCCIEPFVVVSRGARIGARTVIYPHSTVGADVVMGRDCVLYPGVTVYDGCVLGDRVTLHSGCVIGQDGFGYATHGGQHHKIPQVGNVVIEDDVEMGACCTVDRATVGSTRIGKGSKFSDLVAIGHGASIGEHNLLVAQVGIAGSTQTGRYVVMGGQAGVAGHLKIGDGAQVSAKAGVMDDLAPGGQYGGQPALPMSTTKRNLLALNRLPGLIQELRQLQKRVEELQAQLEEEPRWRKHSS